MFWLKRNLPRLVIAPSFGVLAWFVYGFILWTVYISFTKSKLLKAAAAEIDDIPGIVLVIISG